MIRIKTILTALLLTFAVTSVFAQSQELKVDNSAMFWVDGTSTLHDWTVESNKATGIINVTDETIASVWVQVAANSLESGKSGMDRRMYDALDSRNNNQIRFESSSIELNDDKMGGVAKGQLTIAGQKRDHEVPFTLNNANGNWTFSGSTTFTMSKFDIDPPTAVMGTIRTGDEITVRFEIKTDRPQIVRAQ
jgi:polyisoprenoid-binding protein YceI